ncbi:MAG: hypothetical protein GY894_12085 [Planctomycetes bacterium]|nr:hypothetical protein [Planctomycetota bacterium]
MPTRDQGAVSSCIHRDVVYCIQTPIPLKNRSGCDLGMDRHADCVESIDLAWSGAQGQRAREFSHDPPHAHRREDGNKEPHGGGTSHHTARQHGDAVGSYHVD